MVCAASGVGDQDCGAFIETQMYMALEADGKSALPQNLRVTRALKNDPEFVAKDLRQLLADTGAKTLYIDPGSPWENGYCESINSKLRDALLNGGIFYSIEELRMLAERWRVHYNTVRPH